MKNLKFLKFRVEGVFAEKGARFRGKRGLATPPPTPASPPPFSWGAVGVFIGGGGEGPGVSTGNLGVGGGPVYRENGPPFRRKRLIGPICQRFRKGVGGRGLAANRELFPRIVSSFSQVGIGKRVHKRGLNLCHRKDFLAPTPSVRQPLFETSEIGGVTVTGVSKISNAKVLPRVSCTI